MHAHATCVTCMQRQVKAQAQSTCFCKLQVLSSDEQEGRDEASVAFRVWFKVLGTASDAENAAMQTMTERSNFEKVDGRWLYLEAASVDHTPYDFPESL